MGDFATKAASECGKVVLFVGVECKDWTPAQFAECAQFARAHKIDTISPKRADGSIKWYGDAERLAAEREAVLHEGVGYLPFIYMYGPRFGDQQVRDEAAVCQEIMHVCNGDVCVDVEAEYDGQDHAANLFSTIMRPVPGLLYLTTWADPVQHNFPVRQFAPCVNAWIPQDYDNWLVQCESQQITTGMSIRFGALDLSQEFGANNVAGNAAAMRARGHLSMWLWEYEMARNNPAELDQVVAAFLG